MAARRDPRPEDGSLKEPQGDRGDEGEGEPRAGAGRQGGGLLVGIISDTHARLDSAVLEILAGVDAILHAGDVGDPKILTALGAIAPVTAVRGNTDTFAPLWDLPEEIILEIGDARMVLGHKEADLLRRHDPVREGLDAVVSGHSHRPKMDWRSGVLYLNPGSAGPKRFALPRSVVVMEVMPGPLLRPRIVDIRDDA
jgi:uncharacterized protein